MPNHCSQDLYVYGPADTIKQFLDFSKQNGYMLSADKYIPYPQKFKDLDAQAERARLVGIHSVKDGFNSGGYEWCVENWGTKWGIYDCLLTKFKLNGSRSQLNYTFNSAWSPATKIIFAMSQKFPELRFKLKYYEAGMCFKGVYEVMGGQVHVDTHTKYRGKRGG